MQGKLADGGTLVAELAGEGLVASSTYSNLRPSDGGAVEIGSTFLARRLWGGDTNRAIKRLMLRHTFASVETAEFLVWERNFRSRRAVEKIGASLTERNVAIRHRGTDIVHLVYAITRSGFASGPLAAR